MSRVYRSAPVFAVLAGAGLACGPAVDSDSAGDSAMTTSASTGSTVTATTSTNGPATSTTSTGTSSTVGTTFGTSSTSSGGGSGSTGDGICSCEGVPIGFDEMTDDGLTAAEVVATFNGGNEAFPVYWHGLENQPPSMATVELTYDGGAVIDEVGGCCGIFLCAPCPEGLTVDVNVQITSMDGIVDETATAQLGGIFESFEGRQAQTERVPPTAAGGSWPTQTFVDGGAPFDVQEIWVVATRYPDDPQFDTLEIYGGNADDAILIGASFEMP